MIVNHIPKIVIKTIKPENHRYLTCGDFLYDAEDDTLTIFISRMSDWRSELAVAVHEAFESVTCLASDVKFKDIDLFDMNYEAHRKSGNSCEPGDSPDAPYHSQHVGATWIEKEVCSRLDLPWETHERNVNDL